MHFKRLNVIKFLKTILFLFLPFLLFSCAPARITYYPPSYSGYSFNKIPLSAAIYYYPILDDYKLNNTVCNSFAGSKVIFHTPCGSITTQKSSQAFQSIFTRLEHIDYQQWSDRLNYLKEKNLNLLIELKLLKYNQISSFKSRLTGIYNINAQYEVEVTFINADGKVIWTGSKPYNSTAIEWVYDPITRSVKNISMEDQLKNVSDQISLTIDNTLSLILDDLEKADLYALYEKNKIPATRNKEYKDNDSKATKIEPKIIGRGTGFPIGENLLATAAHVVAKCDDIIAYNKSSDKAQRAKVLLIDTVNDVALLTIKDNFSSKEIFRLSEGTTKTTDRVYTVGFPLSSTLGIKPNYTEGYISSTLGIRNDPRFLQVSVPIQPGSSGGPLLNKENLVVGMISSKLNDMTIISKTGVIPQNVNFAIKSDYITILAKTTSQWKNTSNMQSKEEILNSVVFILCSE